MSAEILAPAGDEQSAYAALLAGADAIYLGLTQFSARQSAQNLDVSALERVTKYAHILGAKVYVCLNTLVKDEELSAFFESARLAHNAGADAILIQDLFLGKKLKEVYPQLCLHLSTQAGCCNEYGARLAKSCGFSRVVLARETPFGEIEKIAKIIETEVFVQGALCTCFSGQCYFSSFAGNNSGNRGRCKQPCRKQYSSDRKGYESLSYALSPADLCAGERVKDYIAAGVCSLKIEGRMRRTEYTAAAVEYYRALLNGAPAGEEFSRLKRAFNRGDYTKGLAFGQDKTFLSRNVQGHVGEAVGKITLRGGKYFCKSAYSAQKGDGFKILRGGKEAGGAAFLQEGQGGFFLASNDRLYEGDEVRVTTDTAALQTSLGIQNKRTVRVKLRFVAGEPAYAEGEGISLTGEVLSPAKSAPLTREELVSCFMKTDMLPLNVLVEAETSGAFLPKSALNAFRRAFYEKLVLALAPAREEIKEREFPAVTLAPSRGTLTAVIGVKPAETADIFIYKPQSYRNLQPPKEGCYLYLPAYFTSGDEALVAPALSQFEGIYCEGYYGIELAKKYRLKLFAGTGFNLTNRYAVDEIKSHAQYFALSKELSFGELARLNTAGAFVLNGGAVKLMDLCYCPFEQTCSACDKREIYHLVDEGGRSFPLRRVEYDKKPCRFELYNCAQLCSERGDWNALSDDTVEEGRELTRGHFARSMQ